MADYDQGVCPDLQKTKDGIDRSALYQSSVGRCTNAAACWGFDLFHLWSRGTATSIYVLRMPVTALLMEKDSGSYKGVWLASGQDIFWQKLVLDPSFTLASLSASPSDLLHESFNF